MDCVHASAARVAALVAGFDRSPAYAGLARALVVAVGDGRLPPGTRLPSERDLTEAVGVSRTTVTRAYAALREAGYAEARQGAGTFTRLPGGVARTLDRAFAPRAEGAVPPRGDGGAERVLVDLGCAATTAPPGLAEAYAEAAAQLPAYLGGHGYFPAGLPALQEAVAARFEERGLPTAPQQVLVTPGALAATAVAAGAFAGRGTTVLVETPGYPNAVAALRQAGARPVPVPVDPGGWDLEAVASALREGPRVAHLVPDFHNPTGLLMGEDQRAEYAALLRRARVRAFVDEAHTELALDLDGPGSPAAAPRPFAAFARDAVTVGSASKAFWGGLRLGWLRVPEGDVDRAMTARLALDLGAPVLEQLVLVHLLARREQVLAGQRARLREQRDRLVAAVARDLPDWRARRPGGGLALWCELPVARATALAVEAERRGVVVTPGPVFAVGGGLDRWVRIAWTRPGDELETAVRRLAEAWAVVRDEPARPRRGGRRTDRVLVA